MLTNIIQLQRLFDKYIYSLYDEASLIAIEKQEKYIDDFGYGEHLRVF